MRFSLPPIAAPRGVLSGTAVLAGASVMLVLASAVGAQAASVRHAAPVQQAARAVHQPLAARSVFAVDSSNELVRLPSTGGTPVAVASHVSAYALDAAGDAYAVTSTRVVEVAASGVTRTLVSGATDATGIRVDARGDVYLLEGTEVVRISAGTRTAGVVADAAVAPIGFSVSARGTVSLFESSGSVHRVVTYPVGGTTSTTSVVTDSPYSGPVSALFDAKGAAYYRSISTGGSGALSYQRVAAGATTPTLLGGGYLTGGVGLNDDFYLMQSATSCTSYGLGTGTCVPDLSVAAILVTTDTGVTTRVPVSGLSLGTGDEHPYSVGSSVTSDASGTIYVASPAGISRYAAAGGAQTTLAAGAFTDVQLNR
jgi:hypothetical protein